jgi:hypothetical protein
MHYLRIEEACKNDKDGWYKDAFTISNSMRLAALESEFENPVGINKFNQLPPPASENDGEVFRCMMGNYKVKVNVFVEV